MKLKKKGLTPAPAVDVNVSAAEHEFSPTDEQIEENELDQMERKALRMQLLLKDQLNEGEAEKTFEELEQEINDGIRGKVLNLGAEPTHPEGGEEPSTTPGGI